MIRTLPTFKQATNELSELIPYLLRGLEAGILSARAYFDDEKTEGKRPLEPYLFAMLVRYRAKLFLDNEGIKAEIDLDLEWLPNIGLMVVYGDYLIRIRLSPDLRLPVPGKSERLQEFYRQEPEFIPLLTNLDELTHLPRNVSTPIRVLLLWRTTPPTYRLEANLACPRDGGVDRDSVAQWWNERIPQPFVSPSVTREEPGERDDLATEPTEKGKRDAEEER